MKSLLTLVSSIIALVGVVGVPSAFAQSADWNLTVNFINVPFQTDQITVDVYGPFSSSAIQHQVIPNGQDPQVTFTISGNQIPQGYGYRVCASATAIGWLSPTCQSYTHGDRSSVTMEISPN
jgi:hypothetical protein